MLIQDLIPRFCRYCSLEENLAPTTVRGIKATLNLLLKRVEVKYLKDVTADVLREFLDEGKEKLHWSTSYRLNHMKYLKKFFNWCIEKGYVKDNPVLEIKRPKLEKKLPRVLTKEEAQTVLCASFSHNWFYTFEQYRNYAMIAIMLYTGIRASELLALKFDDVNLSSERIFIRKGKGRKERYVPMHRKLKNILESYVKERKRLKKSSEWFFTGAQSEKQLGYKYLGQVCNKLAKATGIAFTAHTLRHTAATELLNQGVDIYKVSRILGHTDIKTTTIYLHTATRNLQESVNAVELY